MKGRPLMLAKSMLVSPSKQQGAVAVFMILALPFLIGTMGYALDVGKWFVVKSELQNAADACALAAAYELDGQAGAQARASAAGLNLAQANKVLLQENLVTTSNTTVSFFSNANGDFVRCNITQPNIVNTFLNVLGIGDKTIAAAATATNRPGQNTCALPIGVCSSGLNNTTPVGTWISGIVSPNSGNKDTILNGNFKWVDLTNGSGGANELADVLSGVQPENCKVDTTNPYIGTPGYKASLRDDYNTRFGIVKKNVSEPYITDFSGKGYYNPATQNRYYNDFLSARTNSTPYTNIAEISISNAFKNLTSGELKTNGSNRRVAIAPVVDCSTMKLERFVCVFLLHPMPTQSSNDFNMYLEYLGNPATQSTPCGIGAAFAGSSNGVGPRVSTLVQ